MKAIIRQEARLCLMKWVKCVQRVADTMNKEAKKHTLADETALTEKTTMNTMMTEVSSSRGRTAWTTSARSLMTAAVLVGQLAEGAATSVMMPLKISMHNDKSDMMITMMVCSTIFAAGFLMTCPMQ